MIKRTNLFTVIFLLISIMFSDSAFAGGGGKGGGGGRSSRPSYYSFEDLRSGISRQSFIFANDNKPVEALVPLGYFPVCAATASKKSAVIYRVSSDPAKFGIQSFKVMTAWNDSKIILFDWNKLILLGGRRCDLIFTRGNGKAAELVKRFSNWTHVAIVDDVYNRTVFESTPDTGVKTNKTDYTWRDLTYFTCKKIKLNNNPQRIINYADLDRALDIAKQTFAGKPYFPKVSIFEDLISGFVLRWSDKYDKSSMYCSKLVYNTFKDLVDFDTNRTKVDNYILKEGSGGGPFFAWIGISPDDIYFSDALEYDFCYSDNVLNL